MCHSTAQKDFRLKWLKDENANKNNNKNNNKAIIRACHSVFAKNVLVFAKNVSVFAENVFVFPRELYVI
jgi:hypothetical protein